MLCCVLFRPGSADPDVYPPSMLVTADLGTMEYYYQLTIFNTLNGAINRGYVGSFEVSPHGFSFRPISGRNDFVAFLSTVLFSDCIFYL